MTHAPRPHRSSPDAGSSVGLPKGVFAALRRQPPPIRVAPILLESASLTSDVVYQRLRSRAMGLTTDEAEARLSEHGPNMVAADGRKSIGLLVWHAVITRSYCCWRSWPRSPSPRATRGPGSSRP